MATRNTTKTTKAQTEKAVEVEETVENKPTKVSAPKRSVKLPNDMLVECKNITMGKLIYISNKQNGYKLVWSEPGDVEEIELGELISMRNSQPAFFTKNWIGIDDIDVLKYLKVDKYYEGLPTFEDYEKLLTSSLDDLRVALSNMSEGAKETLAVKATEMINDGTIDSVKTVKYLCEALNLMIED